MKEFLGFLNNPWITGIGGGAVSGFLVYFITSHLLSRKEDKEYSQKVKTANNDLLYALRPLVVQKQTLSSTVVESLVDSTARKHGVHQEDLLNVSSLANDLIREVMENIFLDPEKKIEFCEKIQKMYTKDRKNETAKIVDGFIFEKNRFSSQYISTLLAATVSLFVFLTSFFIIARDNLFFEAFLDTASKEIFTLPLVGMLVPMIAITMVTITKRIKEERKYRFEKNFEISSSKNENEANDKE